MKKTFTEKGYAKINLHLDVVGFLPDGYHEVRTVMQSISLFDDITLSDVERIDGEPSFFVGCNVEGVPCDGKNLAVRGAKLFCEKVGYSVSAKIDIQKNIPMAAGMAGGSADAAATLRALNRAFDYPLTLSELCELGARLGADVPFCIVGGTHYADGRGDRLGDFPKMPDCVIVAACEGEGVSTPWAYRLLDEVYEKFDPHRYTPRSIDPLRDAMASGIIGDVSKAMYNVFEEPVLSLRPEAARVKKLMLEGGALSAMMSGSGPSVFGIFACEKCAAGAVSLLEQNGYRGYICRPV